MAMSALPPKADVCGAASDVCFGPIADIGSIMTGAKDPDRLCSLASFEIALGFDEPGKGKNFRRRPSHPDLFQNWLELLTKSVEGRSRLPNINHAPAAGHRPGNVREHTLDRPIGEPLPSPLQDHVDALFVFGP